MIKISVSGLADFMTARPARQRTILRHYKYPDLDAARAKIAYYRDARDRIAAFHKGDHDKPWLLGHASQLDLLASLTGGASGRRMGHNATALRRYATHFAERRFRPLSDIQMDWVLEGVRVSVHPDLHVVERKKEKIIKLEFGRNEPSRDTVRIISQAMYEAARGHIADVTSSSVLYLDVRRGVEHKGARAGSRVLRDIEATCKTIGEIWPGLEQRGG